MADALTAVTAEPMQTPVDGYLKTTLNLFLEPSRAFRALAQTRRWLIPILICSLVAVGYEAATSHYRMADLRDRISRDRTLSPDEVARRVGNIDAQRTTSISYPRLAFGATLLTAIHVAKVLAVAALLWFCVRLFHSTATFGQLFSGASFIFLVTVPEKVVLAILMMTKGSYQVYLGPAVLMDSDSSLFTVLDRLDVFSIWMAVLIAVALPILTGISKRRAAVMVTCLWCGWLLLALIPVHLFQIN
jgi:hypothetical protein